MPIWWCIIRSEPAEGMMSIYRIIVAIKAHYPDDINRLYEEHTSILNNLNRTGPLPTVMYFHREPEESPLKDIHIIPDQQYDW